MAQYISARLSYNITKPYTYINENGRLPHYEEGERHLSYEAFLFSYEKRILIKLLK